MTETSEPEHYLSLAPGAIERFAERAIGDDLVMLNLLRFREVANYSVAPDLAPETPISGRDAYALYIAHTVPYLHKYDGEILFIGEGGPFLIGPTAEQWDRVVLVNHKSVSLFVSFATDQGYLAGIGHRQAALQDSRLLPLENLRNYH